MMVFSRSLPFAIVFATVFSAVLARDQTPCGLNCPGSEYCYLICRSELCHGVCDGVQKRGLDDILEKRDKHMYFYDLNCDLTCDDDFKNCHHGCRNPDAEEVCNEDRTKCVVNVP